MKKLIYSLFVVISTTTSYAQNEEMHNAKIIGSFELGSKEITTIYDEVTGCERKTSPHTKNLFIPNESVQIKISDNKQMAEVIKPSLPEQVFANKKCDGNKYGIELTKDQITFVADLHNEILESVFNQYENGYSLNDLNNQMSIISVDNLSDEIRSDVMNESDHNMNYLINNLNDPISLQYCTEIREIILNSQNLNSLKGKLLAISNKIEADKRGFNKTVCLLFSEVSTSSAEFWTGSIGIGVIGNLEIENLSPWARGLIAADGLGASGAFIGYGLLAGVTGPMGWAALVATVGFSAAWSSGTYALF